MSERASGHHAVARRVNAGSSSASRAKQEPVRPAPASDQQRPPSGRPQAAIRLRPFCRMVVPPEMRGLRGLAMAVVTVQPNHQGAGVAIDPALAARTTAPQTASTPPAHRAGLPEVCKGNRPSELTQPDHPGRGRCGRFEAVRIWLTARLEARSAKGEVGRPFPARCG